MSIASSKNSLPLKHEIDSQASKKVGEIISTLKRYETNGMVPLDRVQCSQSARRLLEAPLALLTNGFFSVSKSVFAKPVFTKSVSNSDDYSHTAVPTDRKIPRPS